MSRLRTVKPGFFIDEDLCALPPLTRIFFAGLWCEADREGRLEDRPVRLKAQILPYDDADVSAMLDDLERGNFIRRYTVRNYPRTVIQIVNFMKHQKPHHKEAPSSIPAELQNKKHRPRRVLAPTKVRAGTDLGECEPGGVLSLGSGVLSLGSREDQEQQQAAPKTAPRAVPPIVAFKAWAWEEWTRAGGIGRWTRPHWITLTAGYDLLADDAAARLSWAAYLADTDDFYAGHYPAKWSQQPARWLDSTAANNARVIAQLSAGAPGV